MSRPGKDSSEVVEFMTLFGRLKYWSDDSPQDLLELAKADASVKDLCVQLARAEQFLKMNERRARELFAAPVDPGFVAAWRDYEDRYERAVSLVWVWDTFPELGIGEPSRTSKTDFNWDIVDDEAQAQANGVTAAIDWARSEVENDILDDADFLRDLEEGVLAWDRLVTDHGLDLRGVFRRRALVPFVLVPRQVAAKHGSAETLSMLKNLRQAHDAFVFGAIYAALALMRSIMEAVLRDHYRAEGKDLYERIRNARGRLPPGVNAAALDRLRRLANAILHLDREKDEGLSNIDELRLEKEIVSLLFVLRALIEGAK